MGWKQQLIAFSSVGPSGKLAAQVVLEVLLPGAPTVVSFVTEALGCVHEMRAGVFDVDDGPLKGTADDFARLEAVLGVMTTDLGHVIEQIGALSKVGEEASRYFEEVLRVDDRCRSAGRKLSFLAKRFDRFEKQLRKLVAGHKASSKDMKSALALLTRIAGAVDYLDELREAGLSPEVFHQRFRAFHDGIKALSEGRAEEAEGKLRGLASQQNTPVLGASLEAVAVVVHGPGTAPSEGAPFPDFQLELDEDEEET